MVSKGLIIFLSGIILFIGTIIWIYKDKQSKNKREEELLEKINESSFNIKTNSSLSHKNNTEVLEDSTERLEDSTELLDNTDII